jgi:predicted Fe-S protein YdhL (DUF1289 family)
MTLHSPCRGVCRLDETGQYCTGCHRTIDEVAGWSGFNDEQKELVWARLLSRPLQPEEKWCSVCGNQFQCGSGGENGGCWCQDFPNIMPLSLDASDCLCADCLAKELKIKAQLAKPAG